VKLQLAALDEQDPVVGFAIDGDDVDNIFTKVGFTLGRMPPGARFSSVKDSNPAQMDMAWTPCGADVGAHTLCFEAADSHQAAGEMPGRGFATPAMSEQKCVKLRVEKEPAPTFKQGGAAGAPAAPQVEMLTIGRQTLLAVPLVTPNCQAKIQLAARRGSSLPAGASLRLAATTRAGTPSVAKDACVEAEFHLDWTPAPTQGGFNETVCLEATSANPGTCTDTTPAPRVHCIRLVVHRCRYVLQQDQQLQEVAALFNVDWMRLWSLNPELMHPDYLVYGEQTLKVGHLYSALANEFPREIGKRMGMSDALLRDLNFGLDLDARFDGGEELCVVPNSCTGTTGHRYSGLAQSSLAAYLGRTIADINPIPAASHGDLSYSSSASGR